MDPWKQLNDDGAVIGYRPNLRYTIDKSNGEKAAEQQAKAEQARTVYHSRCLVSFINNTPSKAASAIIEVSNNIEDLVDRLAASFKSGEWSDYNNISALVNALRSGDDKYAEEFVNYHRKNMKSTSIIPEVMLEIYRVNQRMKHVLGTVETLYYGQSGLSKEEMQQYDTEAILKLCQLEDDGEYKNVNYVALANDSSLDRLTYEYATRCNTNCKSLADMALEEIDQSYSANINRLDVIKKLVFEADDEVLYMDDSFNRYHSNDIMSKALYNYYEARSDLIDMYELENKIGLNGASSIETKLYSAQCDAEEALKDVCRAFLGCYNHLENIYSNLKDKKDLKALYSTLFTE